MRTTRTVRGVRARKALREGVNAILSVVAPTFGPEGRNALLYRTMNRGNRITNDGVTVAECQEPKDPFVRMAAQTFKEACKRTNDKVGDGTTCTTILAGNLFNEVFKSVDDNLNELSSNREGVMTLRRKILDSAEVVKGKVKKAAKKIKTKKDLEKIATISVENAEIGKTIADMAWEVGVDGFIDVVEGYKGGIETEVIKGMRFPAKVPAKAFVNKPNRYEMVAEDSPVIITNYALDNAGDFAQAFLELNQTTSKIVVVAPSFSENVLISMFNATKNGFFIYPVHAPSLRTEQFEDLALYCGATFIDKNKGKRLRNVTKADLGFVEKIVVKDTELKEDAIATGGRGAAGTVSTVVDGVDGEVENKVQSLVQQRIEVLKGQLEETKQEQFKKLLERRIASMASAVGIIRVGDSTQANSLYMKLKIEDAVYACKAALRGGYVKGAGACLSDIAADLPEDDVLREALQAPYRQIQSTIGDVEIGPEVIDPAEAIYYAVEHATQVVAQLITVDSITAEADDPIPGEGEYAIAKALMQLVIADKIHKGQIKEGQEEAYMDSLGGLNDYEFTILNRD